MLACLCPSCRSASTLWHIASCVGRGIRFLGNSANVDIQTLSRKRKTQRMSSVQGEDGWRFTYAPTQICAIKGSTVTIHCTFSHPSRINDHDVTVERTFWFTEVQNKEPEDLRTDSKYAGRVQNHCGESDCTLTITDLRESDSHVYEFMLITGQGGRFIGSPGVKLTLLWFVFCGHCVLNNRPSYVWYINGQNKQRQNLHFTHNFYSEDSVSCAVKGFENSPSVCSCRADAPKVPSVLMSHPGDIFKDSSVTLTCSSDAYPPHTYAWNKENQKLGSEPHLVLSSIQSSDSGEYYCTAENELGKTSSKYVLINVKYAPKPPSVSASPSAETVEGSSVNLTCSSDANPAANYTWYKENKDSPKASVQIFTIADIRAEHGGNYLCAAENRRGRRHATLRLTVVTGEILPPKSLTPTSPELNQCKTIYNIQTYSMSDQRPAAPAVLQDDLEYTSICFNQSQTDAVYSNIRWVHPPREREEDKEEEDGVEYSAVRFHSSATG
uniref:Ig-like domain-containing protein n=1 Tax=Scophthalmus maximus TaxID=52904 RepID=A0A8D3BHY7_SCOMX